MVWISSRNRIAQQCLGLVSSALVAATGAGEAAARAPAPRRAAAASAIPARRTYTLSAALERFERQSPRLVAARMRARGLSSAAGVSASFANPSLDYDQELVFPLATEEVIRVKLPIPLGGRFARKREVAQRQARLARAQVTQLSATGGVGFARRYFELLRLHRLLTLRRQSLREHRELLKRISARAAGGGLAGIVATRLELEVRRRRFGLEGLRERIDRLGRTLALAIGDREQILVPTGALLPSEPPPLQTLRSKLDRSSTQRLLRLTLEVHRAEERLAQARRWPDLGLSLGYIRQQAPQPDRQVSHGLVFGLSLPLPLFSSGRREVRVARLRSRGAAWQLKVRGDNSRVLLRDAHGRAARARERWTRYRVGLLKRLPELLRGVRVAFDSGGALSNILESLAAVDALREGGLKLALEARLHTLRLHELAGTLPRR
ncbi:MAG: TolC family protein [bacterium]